MAGEFLDNSSIALVTVPLSTMEQCSILKAMRGHKQFVPLSFPSQPLK